MLAQALTTNHCRGIIELLVKKRRWTMSRIAKVTGTSVEYVRRVHAGKQSLQVSDVEALAKAHRQLPALLLFDSMRREKATPDMQRLFDLVESEVERHREFRRLLMHKPTKKTPGNKSGIIRSSPLSMRSIIAILFASVLYNIDRPVLVPVLAKPSTSAPSTQPIANSQGVCTITSIDGLVEFRQHDQD